jgi:hypothetical protein
MLIVVLAFFLVRLVEYSVVLVIITVHIIVVRHPFVLLVLSTFCAVPEIQETDRTSRL